MTAHPQLALQDQMTIEEFLAFYDTRPEEERWELIEGVPVLSPTPTDYHQIVVTNIATCLMMAKQRTNASWLPMIGLGTKVPVSPNSLPEPDVFVLEGPPKGSNVTDDALVIFEVLSPSNTKADQAWRRKVYASVPNCQHYVTVSLKGIEVTAFDRADSWAARAVTKLDDDLTLTALGLDLPLRDIYRYTPLAG